MEGHVGANLSAMITVMKLECYKILNDTIITILTFEDSIQMPVYLKKVIAYNLCCLLTNFSSEAISVTVYEISATTKNIDSTISVF